MDLWEKFGIAGIVGFFAIIIASIVVWIVNAFKLAGLVMGMNWDSIAQNDWSGIIVHAIGLIGPAAWVTVWF